MTYPNRVHSAAGASEPHRERHRPHPPIEMVPPSLASQPRDGAPEPIHPAPGRSGAAALEVDSLTRRHGQLEAVKGISFEIQRGEVFGLLGPNGAGKTTTISVLSTRLRPHRGDARVFGRSIRTDIAALRGTIGLVPQEVSIYPALTAAENVRFFGHMYGVESPVIEHRVDHLLELVGLRGRRDDPAGNFSGGMKRRLNLAVSLVHEPRLLLLDEPTVGIDPHSRQHIFEIIRNLKRSGTAILYTTHYMEEAEELCDRLAVMDEGKIIAMGSLGELLTSMGCAETIDIRGVPVDQVQGFFGNHPAVSEIDADGGDDGGRLYVIDAKALLEPLHQVLGRYPDATLQISPMSLGDLFLRLTGKELRD